MRINQVKRKFVLPGTSEADVLGFDEVFHHTKHMAILMGRSDLLPTQDAYGTAQGYDQFMRAYVRFSNHPASASTYFEPNTHPGVSAVLERVRINKQRIRLFYGDPLTGIDSLQELDVVGRVNRLSGPMKRLLLVSGNEPNGPVIRTGNIVRILDATEGTELYRHDLYVVPELMMAPAGHPRLTIGVYHRRCQVAAFASVREAQEWIGFMQGSKPEILHQRRVQRAA